MTAQGSVSGPLREPIGELIRAAPRRVGRCTSGGGSRAWDENAGWFLVHSSAVLTKRTRWLSPVALTYISTKAAIRRPSCQVGLHLWKIILTPRPHRVCWGLPKA